MHEIQARLPDARFRPAATHEQIAEAEERLRVSLPESLRAMYLSFDGFREQLTNAQYLLPLADTHGGGSSLVQVNDFFWHSWDLVDLKPYLFFGMSSCDHHWAVDLTTDSRIIAYHHQMGNEVEVAGADILSVYLADQRACLEIDP
jgi:hypothetical protein